MDTCNLKVINVVNNINVWGEIINNFGNVNHFVPSRNILNSIDCIFKVIFAEIYVTQFYPKITNDSSIYKIEF